MIRAGSSHNGNFYPDAVLREAAPMFDGARVFAKSDEEHLAGRGKDVRNLIGRLADARFVAGAGQDQGEIQAVLELIEPTGPIATKLREAWDRGMAGLFGFSIDAIARTRKRQANGRMLREAQAITRVNSVDLIVEPGAGGEVITLIEAQAETTMRTRLIRLIEAKRPALLKDKDVAALTEEELEQILAEAMAEPKAKADDTAGDADARLTEAIRRAEKRAERRADLRQAVAASKLPAKAKARLTEALLAKLDHGDVTDEAIREAIKAEGEYLAEAGGGQVRLPYAAIPEGGSQAERVEQMLEAFFDPNHKHHRDARSFRQIYIQITGDQRVTGSLREADGSRLREALLSGTFADVLGDSIRRQMVRDYNLKSNLDAWKLITGTPVPIADFRTNERTSFGGYGDLPIVAEDAAYQPLTSPTDEKATYAVRKRGGTESVTLEMIKNDDVGAIRRIPLKLARSAKRTLSKFVFDFIRTNPVIYDGLALFHATHGNLGTAALARNSLAARRLAMLRQTEPGSLEPLNVGPKTLLVSPDQEELAADLFRRNTENDKTFIQSLVLDIVPVWYWTDVNDWALASDPMDVPAIEIGFLDGAEEPDLFVQDNPSVGSMFTNDRITWKIRHIYGGNVLDFRAFDKSIVA